MPTTMNNVALNAACATRSTHAAKVVAGVQAPNRTMSRPSWLTVPNAGRSFKSCWRSARRPPSRNVQHPTVNTTGRHTPNAAKDGARRPTRNTPAVTIVAECRYALTGVGAAMAPGSHAWYGYWADLVHAPTSSSKMATVTAVLGAGGRATS